MRGVPPAVLAARSRGVRRVIVPSACACEARLVSGIEVLTRAFKGPHRAGRGGEAEKVWFHGRMGIRREGMHTSTFVDMADARGQPEAVAQWKPQPPAAQCLLGEPGSGKTACVLTPTILPDLDDTAS